MNEARYPLTWPHDVGRTPDAERKHLPGQYVSDGMGNRRAQTFNGVLDRLRSELIRLGAELPVVSTNQPVRNDGMPFAQERKIEDPGAAVYFTLNGRRLCIAIDRWVLLIDNLRAVAMTIEAIRGIERWGSGGMRDRAFMGFAQLPAANVPEKPRRPWREVFGFASDAAVSARTLDLMFKALSVERHPDTGGSDEAFRELVLAREDATKELGG